MKNTILVLLVGAMIIALASCDSLRSEDKENYDSLFLGISFGMGKQEFYDHCWELNKQKVFTHGPTNTSVEYRLANELKAPALMRFYPSFHNEKIYEMPVLFMYEAWAPWNKQYASDQLLTDVLELFKKWYGEEFKVLDHKTMGKVYYKMDKRRRINLFIRDDQYVQAVFTDLKVEKEIKEQPAND